MGRRWGAGRKGGRKGGRLFSGVVGPTCSAGPTSGRGEVQAFRLGFGVRDLEMHIMEGGLVSKECCCS